MDTMRKIAIAYYARASEQEQKLVEEFFRKVDVNGDGKITLEELRKSVKLWLANEKVFKQLDENGDGSLDFDEFLAVYYMLHKTKMLACNGCFELLIGPYFSCFLCIGKSTDSFDLCCDCYHKGRVDHEHSADHFLDHHSLVLKLKDRCHVQAERMVEKPRDRCYIQAEKSQRKREMEELLQIARAHYLAASPEIQRLAYDFFTSMDADGDGHVDLCEFLSFVRQEGHAHMRNSHFFEELDQDGNGTLDFYEVMTLYYIIKSGRPFCDGCGDFIPGIYFSCVECFKHRETSFNLCRKCYCDKKCIHAHDGTSQFLDNFTLLEMKRDPSVLSRANSTDQRSPVSPLNATVPVAYPNTTYHQPYNAYTYPQNPSTLTVIVPASNNNNLNKWKVAYKALEVAINLANLVGCTVM